MPLEPEMPSAVVPLTLIAGLFALFYSLFGVLMCSIPNGNFRFSGTGLIGYAFMFLPIFSFPIYLGSLYSMKLCRNWFSAYFIVDFLVGLIAGGQKFRFFYFFSVPRIVAILAVVLLNTAYLLISHALRGHREKIPGLVGIICKY